jgi:hypothetical protein
VYAREAARRPPAPELVYEARARLEPLVVVVDPRPSNHGGHTPDPSPPRVAATPLGPLGRSDVMLRLRRNVAYRVELDAEISELVAAARSAGVTWARIGVASGLSRDGAVSRWGRRRPGTP